MASIKDRHGNTKLIANRKSNLYYIEEQKRETVSAISEKQVDLWLWHERLGHLDVKDLVKLLNKSGVNVKMSDAVKLYDCNVCMSGKMSSLPFSNSKGPYDEKLKIIYSDVVGPMQHDAIGGAKYIVTFIQDHTRWCEVYLLSKKSEVLTVFKIYKNYVENLTSKKIKHLQTDGGGEYCNGTYTVQILVHCEEIREPCVLFLLVCFHSKRPNRASNFGDQIEKTTAEN